jgi:hypothetical protein
MIAATIVVMLFLGTIGIEAVANALYFAKRGKVFYFDTRDNKPMQDGAYTAAEAVFHPYYSYIHRTGRSGGWWTTNNVGFQILTKLAQDEPGCCDYPIAKREGEVLVGIFGGSVAAGFALATQGSPEFAKQLARVPAWSGKRIRILNFAMPGFKQPQQLLTLAYYLSLGQHFDLVINIDGFNEVVTSQRNWASGTEPSFPADTLWGEWGRQLEKQALAFDRGTSEQYLGAYLRTVSVDWQRRAEDCSFATCFVFRKTIAGLAGAKAAANQSEARPGEEKRTLFPTAIHSLLGKNFNIFDYTANQWASSSQAMADLLRPTGAVYLHVLQPNQWWQKHGNYEPIANDHVYKWVIELINEGYPRMAAKVPGLAANRVSVLDATAVFRGQAWREVYVDDCCHYTDKGNDILGNAIAVEAGRVASDRPALGAPKTLGKNAAH